MKCSKPKPGPPVVSMTTTRETPSASGLAQVLFCGSGAAGFSGTAAVISTSSRAEAGLAAGAAAAKRSARGAATVFGAVSARRGEEGDRKNQTAEMTTAIMTLASIRPNALRMVTLSKTTRLFHQVINAK